MNLQQTNRGEDTATVPGLLGGANLGLARHVNKARKSKEGGRPMQQAVGKEPVESKSAHRDGC